MEKNDDDGQKLSKGIKDEGDEAITERTNSAPNLSEERAVTSAKGFKKKAGRPRK